MRISDWRSDVCSSDLPRLRTVKPRRTPIQRRIRRPRRMRTSVRLRRLQGSRSEERRVGKACVSTWRSRRSPYLSKKKSKNTHIVEDSLTTPHIESTNTVNQHTLRPPLAQTHKN